MEIIENLLITNADLPNALLSRLPIRDNSVVSSLTGSIGKVACKYKGGINKTTINKIKHLLNDCGSLSRQVLIIKAVLKDTIFCSENDHVDVVNIDKIIIYNSRVIK